MQDQYLRLLTQAYSRRTLLKGAAGATGAAGVLLTGDPLFRLGYDYATTVLAQNLSDADILNFALGLEHLENSLYRQANASNRLTGEAADVFRTFGQHEATHVSAITAALTQAGYANIAKEGTYKFPPFDTQENILRLINTVEPVGVGAYTGAARLLKDKTILATAGSIVQVEARHSAVTRALAGERMPVPGPLSEVYTPAEVTQRVMPLIG